MSTQMNRNNYFELSLSDSVFKVFLLSKNDTDIIFGKEKVQELQNDIYSGLSIKVYKLMSGEVLLIREGEDEFPLYPSEDVLLKQLGKHTSVETNEILAGVNIYGDKFPNEADHIATSFLNSIGVNYIKKNPIEIIEAVDAFVKENRNKIFFNQNYLALIAVVGYVINKEYNTNWIMIKSNDVWNPNINYKGHNIFYADYILIDFDNKEIDKPILQSYLSIKDIINSSLR